jgi:hypothetical protein
MRDTFHIVGATNIGKRLLRLLALLAALTVPFVFAGDDLAEGFKAPREQILTQIKRVGFLPIEFSRAWPRNSVAAGELEVLTMEMLAKGGISAVPLSVYSDIESRVRKEQGGWFDPQTGRTIEEKRSAILEKTRAEVAAAHNLDGFAKIWVDVVGARLSGSDAMWHGVREPASFPLGQNALLKLFDNSVGSLPALSVTVSIFDRNNKLLYGRYGGLQLLAMTREFKGVTQFPDIDDDFILSDPVRNRRAIRLALQALVFSPEQVKAQDLEFHKRSIDVTKGPRTKGELRDEEGQVMAVPIIVESAKEEALPAPALHIGLADLKGRVGTIALAPVTLRIGRNLPGRGVAIEDALTRGLNAAGFKTLPSDTFSEIYLRHRATMGPYFDPVSGDALTDPNDALNAAVFEELRVKHGVSAVAHCTVVRSVALHDGKKAHWDGVSQSLAQGGNLLAKLNAGISNGYSGTASAISLELRLLGADQEVLFANRGGLQLLQRMSAGLARLLDVKDAELLTDVAQLDAAVALTTEEMRSKPGP